MPNSKKNKHKRKCQSSPNTTALSEQFKEINLNKDEVPEKHSFPIAVNDKYKVVYSERYGRYLVAKRNLRAGELLLSEFPLVLGPCVIPEPVCLGCYKSVTLLPQQYRCRSCQWPMCKPQCPGLYKTYGHSTYECEFLKEHKTAQQLSLLLPPEERKILYELITILRILLLKVHDVDLYKRILLMESHVELRRQIPELWQHYEENIVYQLKNEWNIGDEYSTDEIYEICGILDVNCFEIGQNEAKSRALYPSAFLLAHDCCANTSHTDTPGTYELILRTSQPIKRGQAITLSYAYTLQGTLKRREFLKAGKQFWCNCQRCSDPRELGTDCSDLICSICGAPARSTEPLNADAIWRCVKCKTELSATKVKDYLNNIDNDLEDVDVHDVVGLENFLERYSEVLGPNHYLLLSAKYSLCQLYGRTEGYILSDMSMDQLKKKEMYCRQFLKVINRLEPGLSRLRGLIQYELHAPIMMMTQFLVVNGLMQAKECRRNLQEVQQLLRESSQILQMEPSGSKEYEMGVAAAQALIEMQNC